MWRATAAPQRTKATGPQNGAMRAESCMTVMGKVPDTEAEMGFSMFSRKNPGTRMHLATRAQSMRAERAART